MASFRQPASISSLSGLFSGKCKSSFFAAFATCRSFDLRIGFLAFTEFPLFGKHWVGGGVRAKDVVGYACHFFLGNNHSTRLTITSTPRTRANRKYKNAAPASGLMVLNVGKPV